MKQSVPKIRSVTRKSDGYRFGVITSKTDPRRSLQGRQMIEDAVSLSVMGDGTPVHGFAVVTWDDSGRRESAFGWKNQLVVDAQLIPQFVAEGLKNTLRARGYLGDF